MRQVLALGRYTCNSAAKQGFLNNVTRSHMIHLPPTQSTTSQLQLLNKLLNKLSIVQRPSHELRQVDGSLEPIPVPALGIHGARSLGNSIKH